MIIGVPKEIKSHEYRVAMLPVTVQQLTQSGHTVLVQRDAGAGSGYEDEDYTNAGATIVTSAEDVFGQAELIVKVKEPTEAEFPRLRRGQVVFTFFHFAASRPCTEACLNAGITALAYETLTEDGSASGGGRSRPLLTPMSEVAGRMAIQEGAKYLEKPMMGRGILLSGVPGVEPAKVTVLGGGVVGANAAKVAAGLGANVVIMDVSLDRLRYLDDVMPANVRTIYSDPHAIAWHVTTSDLVIGAVLIPGARCPVLVPATMLKQMRNGAVVVDVGVDQGGCVETTRPTTHEEPTYVVDGVVHYGVTNMPGAVGRTSTQALCHATGPYVRQLADALSSEGLDPLLTSSRAFQTALNLRDGKLTHPGVIDAFGDLPSQI
ncbi:MAG: alanine dehydrogenase [Planctomycetes bacterium]|jgi:alanine dehydrogenase|nr:alanine dehydrogenase [Planctomycetota bacterium]